MLLKKYTDYETRLGLGQLFGLIGFHKYLCLPECCTPFIHKESLSQGYADACIRQPFIRDIVFGVQEDTIVLLIAGFGFDPEPGGYAYTCIDLAVVILAVKHFLVAIAKQVGVKPSTGTSEIGLGFLEISGYLPEPGEDVRNPLRHRGEIPGGQDEYSVQAVVRIH